jgi:hypothetical protein
MDTTAHVHLLQRQLFIGINPGLSIRGGARYIMVIFIFEIQKLIKYKSTTHFQLHSNVLRALFGKDDK